MNEVTLCVGQIWTPAPEFHHIVGPWRITGIVSREENPNRHGVYYRWINSGLGFNSSHRSMRDLIRRTKATSVECDEYSLEETS